MLLVGQYDSPFVRRVAVSMHMLGLPFRHNTLSVFKDAEAMRIFNPLGRVPSLVLVAGADGHQEVLIDSAAILDHLDETVGPERALVPRTGTARREALRTIAIATGGMDKAVAIVYERLLRPATARHQPWEDRCQLQLGEALAYLEKRELAALIASGKAPQAAITTACLIGFLKLRVPDAFPAGRYPALEKLSAQAEVLPAFQATRPSDTDTAPGSAKV